MLITGPANATKTSFTFVFSLLNDIEKPNGLISNLNYPGDSKLVPEDFGIIRRFCGQRCTDGMNCSVCYRILDMAQPEKVRKIFDKVVQ